MAAEAIARARRGEGPTLIEAETYRFRGHSLADPDELRSKEEKDYYLVRPNTCASPRLPSQALRNQHAIFDFFEAVSEPTNQSVKCRLLLHRSVRLRTACLEVCGPRAPTLLLPCM